MASTTPTLRVNSLYIALFVRSDPPIPDNYHWALYVHHCPVTGGTKYHIVNEGDGWMPGHGPEARILNSFLLDGLVRIADIPNAQLNRIDHLLRSHDNDLTLPGITCRTWLLGVLALLQSELERILKCDDLRALEREVKDWGNREAEAACRNIQPRPVGSSRLSGLV